MISLIGLQNNHGNFQLFIEPINLNLKSGLHCTATMQDVMLLHLVDKLKGVNLFLFPITFSFRNFCF